MEKIVWKNTYKILKDIHDETFKAIDRAIKLEELEKPELAIHEYKKAVILIDRALNVAVEPPEPLDETWTDGCKIVNKMKGARQEILIRMEAVDKELKKKDTKTPQTEINAVTTRPRTYTELAEALREMKQNEISSAEFLDLLFSCDGVKFYRIQPSGEVSTEDEESTLRIVRLEKDVNKQLDSTIFLQVIRTCQATRIENVETPLLEITESQVTNVTDENTQTENTVNPDPSWFYPVIPGVSPCYRTEYGAFIFPDLEANDGSAVGLLIPQGPDEIVLEILVGLLKGVMKQGGVIEFGDLPRERRGLSEAVSESIVKGAYYVSKGLVYSAEKTGQFLSYSTPYLMSKIQKVPGDEPQPIPDNVRTGIEVAKTVTGAASSITGFVANKVGCATMAMGRFLAPHIQKHGSRLLSYSLGVGNEEANERVNDVLTICAGAVEGFGTVYNGLENSAAILGKSLSENTVKIVEHRYGPQAGQTVDSSFDTVGNVINLSRNVSFFTPQGFAKKTAKGTGKALVTEFLPRSETESSSAGASGITYPDLTGLEKEVTKKK